MNGKILLGVLGAAVIALVVGLVVSLGGEGATRSKPPTQDTPPPSPAPTRAGGQRPEPRPEPGVNRPVPIPPGPPLDIPLPGPERVSSHTVATVRQGVNEQLNRCGAGMRGKPDAPSARIIAHLHVRIRDGRLRVTNITVDNAKGLPQDYVACLLRTFGDVETDVPVGQQDAEDILHMPFNVP